MSHTVARQQSTASGARSTLHRLCCRRIVHFLNQGLPFVAWFIVRRGHGDIWIYHASQAQAWAPCGVGLMDASICCQATHKSDGWCTLDARNETRYVQPLQQ